VIARFEDRDLTITGRIFRSARPRDEPYECIEDPESFISGLKQSDIRADLFTFMQEISEPEPKYPFHLEWDSLAVLPVTSYENWLKNQINFKTRNKIRKAQKAGVELRSVPFNDDLVKAIMEIYNESPTRQGKPFLHYAKTFETLKRDHETFLSRSDFVGAFYRGEMIGFIKFVVGKNVASLMQIISKIAHRDKAPTNALIAKAVEMCGERKIPNLHYGIWSRRGLGVFKISHGFLRREIPRYHVPLTLRGKVFLGLRLHHGLRDYLPGQCRDYLAELRGKWMTLEHTPVSADKA
jgi:hypothetical protein